MPHLTSVVTDMIRFERIDGTVALIMGLDRASTQDQYTSVYEKHGLRSL